MVRNFVQLTVSTLISQRPGLACERPYSLDGEILAADPATTHYTPTQASVTTAPSSGAAAPATRQSATTDPKMAQPKTNTATPTTVPGSLPLSGPGTRSGTPSKPIGKPGNETAAGCVRVTSVAGPARVWKGRGPGHRVSGAVTWCRSTPSCLLAWPRPRTVFPVCGR